MKNILLSALLVVFATTAIGQAGGIRIYTGITTMSNQDEIMNSDGKAHTGYHFGADARLMSGGMAFLLGGRFTSVSAEPIDGFALSGHESTLSIINGRVGLDFSIITLAPSIRIRSKALASFDMVVGETGELQRPFGHKLNDGWLGLVSGLGADLGPATVDLEFNFGLINAYNQVSGSTFNSFTFSAGFFF